MKKLFAAFCFLFAAVLAGAGELRIADATGGAPLDVFVQAGVELALEGKINLSMTRQLPSEALKMLDENKYDAVIIDRRFAKERPYIPLAAEALAIYCSRANPGTDLTEKQLLDILTSPRPSWKNYNHLSFDIQRITCKSVTPSGTLLNRIFGNRDFSAEIFKVESISSGFNFINSGSMFFAQYVPLFPEHVKTLSVRGVMPTSGNILNNKYPLTVYYVMIYRRKSADLQTLIDLLGRTSYRRIMSDSGWFVMLPELLVVEK